MDWKTGKVSGDLGQVAFSMRFEDSPQFRGIVPGKPAMFFTKPMRQRKGKVVALVEA